MCLLQIFEIELEKLLLNIILNVFFIKDFKKVFYSTFRFTTKLRGRYRDFSYAHCPYICIAIPHLSPEWYIHYQERTYIDIS